MNGQVEERGIHYPLPGFDDSIAISIESPISIAQKQSSVLNRIGVGESNDAEITKCREISSRTSLLLLERQLGPVLLHAVSQ